MGKFCTSCGAALNEGAKFCTKCGANASPVLEEVGAVPNQAMPNRETVLSKAGKKIKTEAKTRATAYAKNIFSDAAPAYQAAGELALPLELTPATGDLTGEGLLSLLKSGFRGLAGGFKRTLGDKKRLRIVIALAVVWLAVNLFAALGSFPLPLRVLSWLTAARGSLIGGSIGKGLVAALLAQVITNKEMLQSLKGSIGQLTAAAKGGEKAYAPLLLGAGAALIACNLMVSSNLQNTMVCIAGFVLSATALTKNGFLRRFISFVMPHMPNTGISSIMQGWTLGFALFIALCLIPGRFNGYIGGTASLIVRIIPMILSNKKKETAAE